MSDFSAPGMAGFDADKGISKHDGSGRSWETDTTVIPVVNTKGGYNPSLGDPWKTQVGGAHYSKYAIQPTEYILKNGLHFCEGNVIKYTTRWRDKGGIEDLKKARHYLDILISEEEKRLNIGE